MTIIKLNYILTKPVYNIFQMMLSIFFIFALMFPEAEADSTTIEINCPNGATCRTFWKRASSCEIYYGSKCQWPCSIESCSKLTKKHIMCELAICTAPKPKPSPSPSISKNPFIIIIVSMLGLLTLGAAFYFRQKLIDLYKKIRYRRYTNIDDEMFVEGETFELT